MHRIPVFRDRPTGDIYPFTPKYGDQAVIRQNAFRGLLIDQ